MKSKQVDEVSWSDCEVLARRVCSQLDRDDFVPAFVYAPPRGGLFAGQIAAYHFDCPIITHEPPPAKRRKNESLLVIDELLDTGGTMGRLHKIYGELNVAYGTMLVRKLDHTKVPDWIYTGGYYPGTAYIKFPWEAKS